MAQPPEVFFHGGIAFGPYREQYAAITDPSKMHYVETYNASGFFAVQDTPDSADGMLPPRPRRSVLRIYPRRRHRRPPRTPHGVEKDRTYALVITACNGLWRYLPGDTLRISAPNPSACRLPGASGAFINAFGEEPHGVECRRRHKRACGPRARIADYTAAPVSRRRRHTRRHQWLVEWKHRPCRHPRLHP